MAIDPYKFIRKYYDKNTTLYRYLTIHSEMVTQKALAVAARIPEMQPDTTFIAAAAMLHDIGIFKTNSPGIGCNGNEPYLKHGIIGRELLEKEGLPKHALVCERHIGAGISLKAIKDNNLPLPFREMLPVTLEEEIICFADKFYSKNLDQLETEKPIEQIIPWLAKHGKESVARFKNWLVKFKEPTSS